MFTSLPESSGPTALEKKNPDIRLLLNFCQTTSYPKFQEKHFNKGNTDFGNGKCCFEQLRSGNIRTSRNQAFQQKPPNNLGYRNCCTHDRYYCYARGYAVLPASALLRPPLVFCSFLALPCFSLFVII